MREPWRTAALAAVLLAGTAIAAAGQAARPVDVGAVGVVVGGVLAVSAVWAGHRRWPEAAALLAGLVVAGYLVLGGPYGPVQLVVAMCAFALGDRRPLGRALLVGAATAVVLTGGLATRLRAELPVVATGVLVAWAAVFVALPLLLGVVVRLRRDAAARQREELLARGSEAERLRVARDVHDIAGHGFAVVSMQAGVALTVFDEQPDQARRCLEAIRDSADAALGDLHGMLDTLRGPAPGVADLEELVDRVRAAGLPVDLRSAGDAGTGMDEEVSTTVHRVVQEALTNVLRHAGPTTASVEIDHDPDAVAVVVRDRGRGLAGPAAPMSARHGLGSLRARTEALGGTLTVTAGRGGGVEVDARLPRRARS
ncbi:histidine kinase [Actinomycetospora chlora]|uniref:histidine kinase n=1 Tax=Actinomycetospora chlora TaxID=663608 RepID=A0ABP9B6D0_9PSEU